MLSKAELKYINSLQNKKYRRIERAFFVEGYKNVLELINSDFLIRKLYVTAEFEQEFKLLIASKDIELHLVSQKDIESAGTLETNNAVIAIAEIKQECGFKIGQEFILALDGINDPGNLGTIIRTADWYGINNIVCSPDTVDLYNPKVINSTKGSFTRVNVLYKDLAIYFEENPEIPVMAAFMEGDEVYKTKKLSPAILLLGNEANGIRPELNKYVKTKVTIPRIGKAESLNVSIAAAILIDRLIN